MITDLIANGQAKMAEAERREHEKEHERYEAIQAEIAQQEAELAKILRLNFPEDVLAFAGLCTELPVQRDGEAHYRIEAPECTAVSFKIEHEWVSVGDERGYCFTRISKIKVGKYDEDSQGYMYMVDVPGVNLDEEQGYSVSSSAMRYGLNDLEVALAYAHLQWQRLPELKAEAMRSNERLAAKQAREQEAERLKAMAQAKADLQLAEMMDDPIMGPLLNLVNSIMRERADTQQRIADMHEALETTEYYQSEAIGRLERRVSEEARRRSEAEREAESARYEASEAEEKLRKAAKKTSVWG